MLLHTDHRRSIRARARASGEAPRTRAIVIYPMNALANSQREELNKFLDQSGLRESLRPTFARYTGQEDRDERDRIRDAKPDILLTNFMMLELLMTRQDKLDHVIENAQGLDFIVLDELHTYRGRQGADVAMLVRRLRVRLCRDRVPRCIGTSATMSSQDDETGSDGLAPIAVTGRVQSPLLSTLSRPSPSGTQTAKSCGYRTFHGDDATAAMIMLGSDNQGQEALWVRAA